MSKILIIDDDQDILEPLSLLLEAEGYTISTLLKGKEAYQRVQSFKPDIILLDILMSGSDGRTICKNLKADKKTRQIPILMMSAHPEAKQDALDSKADDFVAKPFEMDEVIKKINTFL